MKIGIITFVNEDNYGAVLQAYAMQKYLSSKKIENEFVNVNLNRFKNEKTSFLKKLYVKAVFLRKEIAFRNFRKILNISRFKENQISSEYDAVVIGSDQVWNPRLMGNVLQPIFWGEGFVGKKIGYACSCGNTVVLEPYADQISNYLNNLDFVSVREKSLEKFIKREVGKAACTVLDPVFLLEKEQWKEFIDKTEQRVKRPYIFVYLLEDSEQITAAIDEISTKYNLQVVTLRTTKHYKNEAQRIPGADPVQFLNVLANAEVVVTNSFHALAFSYIFGKKIALFKHSSFNERINDLIRLIGLEDDIYYTHHHKIVDLEQFQNCDEVIRMKELSVNYLDEAIKIKD